MKLKKEAKIGLIVVACVLVLIIFIAAFSGKKKEEVKPKENTDIKVSDELVLESGNAGILNNGKTNATATAALKVSSKSMTDHYYGYLDITKNDYDTENAILLIVKNPDGKEITSISGLEYVTVGDNKGFNITGVKRLINFASNYEIKTDSSIVQKWNLQIKVLAEEEKNFNAKIILQKDELVRNELANACVGKEFGSCIKSNAKLDSDITYHDASTGAKDNSYRYTGANPSNYVCFGTEDDNCSENYLYRIIGVFGNNVKLIKADVATADELGAEASFDSRPDRDYYKGSLKNFDYYHWHDQVANVSWSNCSLNKEVLNKTFLSNLGSYADKIATVNWKAGGHLPMNITPVNINALYNEEIRNGGAIFSGKIGLMYLSDYAYAATSDNWKNTLSTYNNDENINNNWMHLGVSEWTITRRSNAQDAFAINVDGAADMDGLTSDYAVRPVFYLSSKTTLASGNGTAKDPFRIS